MFEIGQNSLTICISSASFIARYCSSCRTYADTVQGMFCMALNGISGRLVTKQHLFWNFLSMGDLSKGSKPILSPFVSSRAQEKGSALHLGLYDVVLLSSKCLVLWVLCIFQNDLLSTEMISWALKFTCWTASFLKRTYSQSCRRRDCSQRFTQLWSVLLYLYCFWEVWMSWHQTVCLCVLANHWDDVKRKYLPQSAFLSL